MRHSIGSKQPVTRGKILSPPRGHSIGSKQPVTRGKILSPPRGTQKEFTSPKLATARVSKGKSSKKSIPGIGNPSPNTMKKTPVPPKEPSVPTGNEQEQSSTNIPAVPVL